MDHRLKLLLWVVAIVALILLISLFRERTREVLLSFDVEPVDTPESIAFVTSTLDLYGANATFFVTGEYALANPDIVRNLSEKYEVACHTMTHPRLPEINDSALEWELATSRRRSKTSRRPGARLPGAVQPHRRAVLRPPQRAKLQL